MKFWENLMIIPSQIYVSEVWAKIFKNSDFPQLYKLVAKVLSIPVSNAYVEHIFSLMSNLWTGERK